MRVRRIGVLTSGGDAPGMNPAVRAVVRAADAARIETYGITSGYDGLVEGNLRPSARVTSETSTTAAEPSCAPPVARRCTRRAGAARPGTTWRRRASTPSW